MALLAAIIFFTRLPLYRWIEISGEPFKKLVAYWSLTGWLTALFTAGTLWVATLVMPYPIAIIAAMIVRLLLTGALHEDGLADFFDGFGGGSTPERILSIMKDSHIGTYGVISLIGYFGLWFSVMNSVSPETAVKLIFIADPGSKFVASFLINRLPYARSIENSKNQTIYTPLKPFEIVVSSIFGLSPLLIFAPVPAWTSLIFPVIFFMVFVRYLQKKINGYTGDCCGSLYLMTEIIFLIALVCIIK
ncbi:MAG: adenosylcobinamide-GDP ribazoletransferase [Bacteroidales bacterium]